MFCKVCWLRGHPNLVFVWMLHPSSSCSALLQRCLCSTPISDLCWSWRLFFIDYTSVGAPRTEIVTLGKRNFRRYHPGHLKITPARTQPQLQRRSRLSNLFPNSSLLNSFHSSLLDHLPLSNPLFRFRLILNLLQTLSLLILNLYPSKQKKFLMIHQQTYQILLAEAHAKMQAPLPM